MHAPIYICRPPNRAQQIERFVSWMDLHLCATDRCCVSIRSCKVTFGRKVAILHTYVTDTVVASAGGAARDGRTLYTYGVGCWRVNRDNVKGVVAVLVGRARVSVRSALRAWGTVKMQREAPVLRVVGCGLWVVSFLQVRRAGFVCRRALLASSAWVGEHGLLEHAADLQLVDELRVHSTRSASMQPARWLLFILFVGEAGKGMRDRSGKHVVMCFWGRGRVAGQMWDSLAMGFMLHWDVVVNIFECDCVVIFCAPFGRSWVIGCALRADCW